MEQQRVLLRSQISHLLMVIYYQLRENHIYMEHLQMLNMFYVFMVQVRNLQ